MKTGEADGSSSSYAYFYCPFPDIWHCTSATAGSVNRHPPLLYTTERTCSYSRQGLPGRSDLYRPSQICNTLSAWPRLAKRPITDASGELDSQGRRKVCL